MSASNGFNPGALGLSGTGGLMGSFASASGVWSLLTGLLSRDNLIQLSRYVLAGTLIETGRRVYAWLSARFYLRYGVSAQFVSGDPAYDWMMLFVTESSAWQRSRDFKVTAKSSQRKWTGHAMPHLADSADYVPAFEDPMLFRWRGYWVDVKKGSDAKNTGGQYNPYGGVQQPTLSVTIFSRRPALLSDIVEDARKRYVESGRPRVTIHLSDAQMIGPRGTEWNVVISKPRRPLNTLTLEPGIMDSILADAREFLKVEDWYTEVGIPHRRGYLLHGPPGTGKTSTIYAIAGELGLEIYSLSLAARHIDDSFLQRLTSSVPRNSILLIEDIDCAFARDDDEDGSNGSMVGMAMPVGHMMAMPRAGRAQPSVTLSGLLNVLDGVGSDEGRIFFATTNYYDKLDEALLRPGRIDKKIEYKLATRDQARALFERFFPESRFGSYIAPTALHAKPYRDLEKGLETDPSRGVQGEQRRLMELADEFTEGVPPHELTTAEIQGYLLGWKTDPVGAVRGVAAWVDDCRREKKEKKERERRKQEVAEEKAKKMAEAAAERSLPKPKAAATAPGSSSDRAKTMVSNRPITTFPAPEPIAAPVELPPPALPAEPIAAPASGPFASSLTNGDAGLPPVTVPEVVDGIPTAPQSPLTNIASVPSPLSSALNTSNRAKPDAPPTLVPVGPTPALPEYYTPSTMLQANGTLPKSPSGQSNMAMAAADLSPAAPVSDGAGDEQVEDGDLSLDDSYDMLSSASTSASESTTPNQQPPAMLVPTSMPTPEPSPAVFLPSSDSLSATPDVFFSAPSPSAIELVDAAPSPLALAPALRSPTPTAQPSPRPPSPSLSPVSNVTATPPHPAQSIPPRPGSRASRLPHATLSTPSPASSPSHPHSPSQRPSSRIGRAMIGRTLSKPNPVEGGSNRPHVKPGAGAANSPGPNGSSSGSAGRPRLPSPWTAIRSASPRRRTTSTTSTASSQGGERK